MRLQHFTTRSFFPALGLLALLGFTCRPACAQWAVIDGANLQENITKYTLAAQAHMTQMAQWENEVMREELMVRNMEQNALATRNDLSSPLTALYGVSNALSGPMLQGTAVGDVAGTLKQGIQLGVQTNVDMQYTSDAIGQALAEAEQGGSSDTAQLHAGNQLAALQAEIAEAEFQEEAAKFDEEQAAEEEVQKSKDAAAQQAQQTHYAAVVSGTQATDSASGICNGKVKDQYCQSLTSW